MAVISPEHPRDTVARLNDQRLGPWDYAHAVGQTLRRAVRFDGFCVLTMDPETILATGEVVEGGLPDAVMPRMTEIEVREQDHNKFSELVRAARPAASLSEATGGNLDRSLRHRELRRPSGFEDELRSVLAVESGIWGALTLLRKTGTAHFTPSEVELVASLSPLVAEGLRDATMLDALTEQGEIAPEGFLVLAEDGAVQMANAIAADWMDELRLGGDAGQQLPMVIQSVAERARGMGARTGQGETSARARVRGRSGAWVLVRASLLGGESGSPVGVTVESAPAPELAPLIADAYGLTERERAVTELVAQGMSTSEIGLALYLSGYTVQDHLKSIFEKVGVSSRGELVARLFFGSR